MTKTYLVKWSGGLETTETSDSPTPSDYAISRWGMTLSEVNANGTTITDVTPDQADPVAEKAAKIARDKARAAAG